MKLPLSQINVGSKHEDEIMTMLKVTSWNIDGVVQVDWIAEYLNVMEQFPSFFQIIKIYYIFNYSNEFFKCARDFMKNRKILV